MLDREAHLTRVSDRREPFDVVVIGGGASGCGVAVDAASRGFSVLLVDAHDFGKGTSSRSTKLIHGGVRYLAQGRIGLVREALRERAILRRNAPHLVSVLSIVVPATSYVEAGRLSVGLKLYDLLAGGEGFGPSRYLSRTRLYERLPQMVAGAMVGGIRYFDGQFDDARMIIALVRAAVDHGATVVNHCAVTGFIKEATGLIRGVRLRDAERGEELEVSARAVVNATGPFTDTVRRLDRPDAPSLVTPSQGAHVVVPRAFLPGADALLIPRTPDGRIMFAIPWHDHVLLGTTDTPLDQVSPEPVPRADEVAMILEVAGRYLTRAPTGRDVRAVFAGIRPLARASFSRGTARVSRKHRIEVGPSGLVTITGGKWTTYRKMAEDCVDAVIRTYGLRSRPCQTADLLLHGAPGGALNGALGRAPVIDHLVSYGTDAEELRQLIRDRPELGQPLHPELPYVQAECVWAARQEMARTLGDVLARRLRALFLNARAATAVAPRVARLLAEELGRDDRWQADQVASFRELAANYTYQGAR